MRTVAIVCGAGVATSALIAARVRRHLEGRPDRVRVREATVMDLLSPQFTADVVLSTVAIPSALGIPVISAMPILLQTAPDTTLDELDRQLAALDPSGPDGTNGPDGPDSPDGSRADEEKRR